MSFSTLSSSSGSTANTEYSDTPLTTPSPSTHDASRASYHISDIAAFASDLQDAANKAFPNRGRSRYLTVNVCLIRWAEDNLLVKAEVDALHDVFALLYGFNTEIWLIPSSASQIKLTSMTCNFVQQFDVEDNLFIVYYGGHGKINNARQNQWWCRAEHDSPVVDWSAIQTLFGTAVSDVLVLLDCCAAASSASGIGTGVMEGIAACGFEARAPIPGQYSFTNTLVDVLVDWCCRPSFSVAMLHTEILFVLKQKRPERGRDGRRLEWCTTPIHWVSTGNPKASGIEICPLRIAAPADTVTQGVAEGPTTYVDSMEIDDSPNNPLEATNADGTYKVPHVLISVALEEDQGTLDAVSCRRWLADFPALVKYANIEGVYRGYSTLLTLSVPVMIWDMLPEHPACSFIGYAVSPNMQCRLPAGIPSLPATSKQACASCRARRPRKSMRNHSIGLDSSYGSDEDEEHHMNIALAVRQACLARSGKTHTTYNELFETVSDSSDWVELLPDSSGREEKDPRSLLYAMQQGIESAGPVEIVAARSGQRAERGGRYRSPDQRALFSVRRGKICHDISQLAEMTTAFEVPAHPQVEDQPARFRKRSKSC